MARTVRTSGATDNTASAALGGGRRSVRSSGTPETKGRATRTTRTTRDTDDDRAESRGSTTRKGGRGFGAYKENVKESKREFNSFRVEDETLVIAFLEDEPFDHVFRHWINRQPRNCIGDECPACMSGDNPKAVLMFNVVNMDDPTKVLLWEASAEPVKRIEKRYDDLAAKGKKLNDEGVYFEVSKAKGKNGFTEYSVDRLYENVLIEEWDMQPLTAEDREALSENLYTSDVVKYNTAEEIQEWLEGLED